MSMNKSRTIAPVQEYRVRSWSVSNNSKKYALRGLGLRIVLEDCEMLDKQTSCTVVAETTNNLSINVPPGQARDFSEGIYGLGSPIAKGNMVWRYEVTYIRGESY